MDRRDFIKTMGAGVVGLALVPLAGKPKKDDAPQPKVIRVKADGVWYDVPMVKSSEDNRDKYTTMELDADTTTLTLTNFNIGRPSNGWTIQS